MPDPIVLQKVVFPSASDPDVAPLYVDPDEWTNVMRSTRPPAGDVKHRRGAVPDEVDSTPVRLTHHNVVPMLDGRRGLRPGYQKRISLAVSYTHLTLPTN